MWIKGGNRIWGNQDSAPVRFMLFRASQWLTYLQDDPPNATDTHGRFLSFRHDGVPPEDAKLEAATVSPNMTSDEASPYVLMHTPSAFQRMIASNYSYGFEGDEERLKENAMDHTKVRQPFGSALHPDCSLTVCSGPTRSKSSVLIFPPLRMGTGVRLTT